MSLESNPIFLKLIKGISQINDEILRVSLHIIYSIKSSQKELIETNQWKEVILGKLGKLGKWQVNLLHLDGK